MYVRVDNYEDLSLSRTQSSSVVSGFIGLRTSWCRPTQHLTLAEREPLHAGLFLPDVTSPIVRNIFGAPDVYSTPIELINRVGHSSVLLTIECAGRCEEYPLLFETIQTSQRRANENCA